MSSSKQTKFSGTKAAGISILALCLLAFSQLLALLIGNMLVAGGMSAAFKRISSLCVSTNLACEKSYFSHYPPSFAKENANPLASRGFSS